MPWQNVRMNDDWISVKDIAAELGKRKQYVFKVLQRLGIESRKAVGPGSRGQKLAYISRDDFAAVRDHLADTTADGEVSEQVPNAHGYFYLIQLEPEHDPGRFKVGFATSIDERMRAHKTAAPLCELVNTWPCKLLWEKTAIDAVTTGCERLYTEVFRADSVKDVEARCVAFFELMPSIGTI